MSIPPGIPVPIMSPMPGVGPELDELSSSSRRRLQRGHSPRLLRSRSSVWSPHLLHFFFILLVSNCALTTAWSTTAGAVPSCKFVRHLCPPWLMQTLGFAVTHLVLRCFSQRAAFAFFALAAFAAEPFPALPPFAPISARYLDTALMPLPPSRRCSVRCRSGRSRCRRDERRRFQP